MLRCATLFVYDLAINDHNRAMVPFKKECLTNTTMGKLGVFLM